LVEALEVVAHKLVLDLLVRLADIVPMQEVVVVLEQWPHSAHLLSRPDSQ
jgi:hypothetical protein